MQIGGMGSARYVGIGTYIWTRSSETCAASFRHSSRRLFLFSAASAVHLHMYMYIHIYVYDMYDVCTLSLVRRCDACARNAVAATTDPISGQEPENMIGLAS